MRTLMVASALVALVIAAAEKGQDNQNSEQRGTLAMTQLERNKQTVVAFYTRAINDKDPAGAVAAYVGATYIQHNPETPDGPEAFVKEMHALFVRYPEVTVEIKRVIAEGDFVVTHDLVRTTREERGLAGIDIFRLDAGKIVEHWDVRQPVPERPANNNTMF